MTAPAETRLTQIIDEPVIACEASPILFNQDECPDAAEWICHVNGWGCRLASVLMCDDHADAALRHLARCRECAKTLTIGLEPL